MPLFSGRTAKKEAVTEERKRSATAVLIFLALFALSSLSVILSPL